VDKISVLIVDDHAVVRQGLQTFLGLVDDIEVVAEAADGSEAADRMQELVPDIVLMDLVMPGMGGIEATRRIRAISPTTQVIALTSFDEDEDVFESIRAGAAGYLLKTISAEGLISAIRAVHRGEPQLDPGIARKLMKEVSGKREEGAPQGLTLRELDVLGLIAKGLSNREIARDLFIAEKTVKTHVSNILSKLHLADRTQAAIYALREGLVKDD
jgi:two-component system, NarL family, response regulator LiaR